MAEGCWGALRSSHPPITVPAWAVMTTGKDPGEIGLYGFRNRRDHGYGPLALASSAGLSGDAVWEIAGRHGKRSIVVGVPPSYPPRAIPGVMVSCFLTPAGARCFTYPCELGEQIARIAGGYVFDVEGFRDATPAVLVERVTQMTRKRFQVARHLLQTVPWDLFMMVEMGPDRLHHGLWRYIDPAHPAYEPGGAIEAAVKGYYTLLDEQLGELLDLVGAETAVLVVSDHGAKRLQGTVRFNDWLIARRHLRLLQVPDSVVGLAPEMVDWRRTRAWGDGGYYGRLFLNVRGREPEGCVDPRDYERVRTDLLAEIGAMEMGAEAHRPEDLYRCLRGVAPDLLVYFGDLSWRALGSVGWREVAAPSEEGADGANHDWDGIFVLRVAAGDRARRKAIAGDAVVDPGAARCDAEASGLGRCRVTGLCLLDVAPTILAALGVPIPPQMRGRPVKWPPDVGGTGAMEA